MTKEIQIHCLESYIVEIENKNVYDMNQNSGKIFWGKSQQNCTAYIGISKD